MHLHFLRARTVASYNDLTWHIFASFLCFVFIFISPYGSIKFHILGKPCKQVFLSNVHFIKTKSLESKILAFTHTSRFFTCFPTSADRNLVSTLYFFLAARSLALLTLGLINNSSVSAVIGFFVNTSSGDSSPRLLSSFKKSFTNRSSRL